MARVSVRIDIWVDGGQINLGVPVRFRPVVEDADGHARRFDRDRQAMSIIAPVSAFDGDNVEVWVPEGDYDVEAVLPSGEPLRQEICVGGVSDDPIRVVLRGERSPNEWRSWGHFAGAELASAAYKSADLPLTSLDARGSLEVSVGGVVDSTGPSEFDPSSWSDWFSYLDARYRQREPARVLALDGNPGGLTWTTEGGYGGTPLRILFSWAGDYAATAIGERRWFASITGEGGSRLIALPLPWGDGFDGGAPFEVLALDDRAGLRCDPVLKDGRWAGIVAYLNRGRVDLASDILMSARGALFGKFENPLAAAIGGYILLSSPARPEAGEAWPVWLANLTERFPHLPDGPILRARLLLAQNTQKHFEEAHELLVAAAQRGIPYFTTGVVWLIEGLEQAALKCHMCEDILTTVRGVARSMDLSQAFTSFVLPRKRSADATYTLPDLATPATAALLAPPARQGLLDQSPNSGLLNHSSSTGTTLSTSLSYQPLRLRRD